MYGNTTSFPYYCYIAVFKNIRYRSTSSVPKLRKPRLCFQIGIQFRFKIRFHNIGCRRCIHG